MGKFAWLIKGAVLVILSVAIFGSAYLFYDEVFIKPYRALVETDGAPLPTPPDLSIPELEKALDLVKKGEKQKARAALETFLIHYPFSTRVDEARAALGQLNIEAFFSPTPSPEKIRYVVVRGDALIRIERKLNVSREILMRSNRLSDPRRLRVGQELYVSPTEFSLNIDSKTQRLTLLNQHRFFKEYQALEWNVPPPPKGQAAGPISTKVQNRFGWHDGSRVTYGHPDYDKSLRWVEMGNRRFTLYAVGGPKPKGGIGLSDADMEELSTLLSKNVPVSIQ